MRYVLFKARMAQVDRGPMNRSIKLLAVAFVTLVSVLLPSMASAADDTVTFALIVAHNASGDPDVASLRFADDDGARFFELMAAMGASIDYLSVLDAESQATFSSLVPVARVPSRANLDAAMTRIRAATKVAKAAGKRTQFYFFFAGHGHVGKDREGYVHLVDGKFRRSDLFRAVIARSTADVNHVIIDACNAYFLVNRRGEGATERAALSAFLERESLGRYPNTGVILSTASEQEVHEWTQYRSGVFSHQLLSAMAGAADVDGSGGVDYQELGAFIAAANLSVRDPRAKLDIFARPPTIDRDAVLVRPPSSTPRWVMNVPAAVQGHYHLEDDRGVRYADFHKTDEQAVELTLVRRPFYYLRRSGAEAKVVAAQGDRVRFDRLQFKPRPITARGTVEESYRLDLYRTPFGKTFVMGFEAAVAQSGDLVLSAASEVPGTFERPATWGWITAGLAVVGAGVGTALLIAAQAKGDDLEAGKGAITLSAATQLQSEQYDLSIGGGVALGLAGALVVTAGILFAIDPGEEDAPATQIVPSASAEGAGLSLLGRF
ncbi:MAG: hypothetical protein ACI9MR_002395 [Myxococcota bacterium]|jgi:hypothetical protein